MTNHSYMTKHADAMRQVIAVVRLEPARAWQSVAIRGHQWPARAWQSVAIRGHQWQSEVISSPHVPGTSRGASAASIRRSSKTKRTTSDEYRSAGEPSHWPIHRRCSTMGIEMPHLRRADAQHDAGDRTRREVIRGPQRPSEALRGQQRPSEAIRGPQCPHQRRCS